MNRLNRIVRSIIASSALLDFKSLSEAEGHTFKVGDKWLAIEGYGRNEVEKEIVGENEEKFFVKSSDSPYPSNESKDRFARTVFIDIDSRKKLVKRNEVKMEESEFNLMGYEKTLSNLQRGKALVALKKPIRSNGVFYKHIRDFVVEMIENRNAEIGKAEGKTSFLFPNGSYIFAPGKHAANFAEFLLRKRQ